MGERGDLTQRGPVPVRVPWGPGLGAAASHSASHAPSLTAPGRFCLSLPGSTPAFQWAVGRRMRPDAPSAGPLPLGLETSLAPSPHWELGQPSCFPQSLPDSPPSWSHPSTGFTPPSHFLPLRVALGFCLQLKGVSLGPDSFLHFPEVGLSCGPPPSPHTLLFSEQASLCPQTGSLHREAGRRKCLVYPDACEPNEGSQCAQIHTDCEAAPPQVGALLPEVWGPAAWVLRGSRVPVFTVPPWGSWKVFNQCLVNK